MRVPDAYRVTPKRHSDNRGHFHESFRNQALSTVIGHPFNVAQVNCSVSQRNTLRGLHSTVLQPGTAKYVTCARGAILDVVVDLRVGSPTFGSFDVTELSADDDTAVYMADGLGHAFLALTDDTCVYYLCSEAYVPGTMIEVNPLDPELALPWKLTGEPVMSAKDLAAPSLAEAAASGVLPTYEECLARYAKLRGTNGG